MTRLKSVWKNWTACLRAGGSCHIGFAGTPS